MPAVSVVLPTYNRKDQLRRALEALARQTMSGDELEIVVVSDGSTDGTDEEMLAGRSPVPVTFIQQPNQGVAVARNSGVAAAGGDLILFIDDDVEAEPECAEIHLRAHEASDSATVVIGPLLTPENGKLEPWVQWEQTMLYKQYDAMARGDWAPTARQFYTGNASLTRDDFNRSGGFDPSYRRGEDVELAYRLNDAGMSFEFEFKARAFHHASRSYRSWLSNATAYGRNDVKLWRDEGQAWILPAVRAELNQRNPLTRLYTSVGLRIRGLGTWSADNASIFANAMTRIGLDPVAQVGLSAVYNLAYYRGVVDELGSLAELMAITPDVPDQHLNRGRSG